MKRPRKGRSNGRDGLLSVGDVAQRLGMSEDVVRSLIDSGELKAVRTGGGHRRCPPEEVKQFKTRGGRRKPNRAAGPRTNAPRSTAPPPVEIEDEERRLQEYQAEIEHEAARERTRAEDERLEGWKKYGRDYARWSILPSEWHVLVVEDLETFVTTRRIPPTLQAWEAQQIVQARVNALVKEYRDAERARQEKEREAAEERQRVEAERKRAEDERRQKERDAEEQRRKQEHEAAEQRRKQEEADQKLKALIDHGNSHAWSETISWNSSEAERARRDVARALKEEVKADWTEAEVEDLVDDVLYEDDEGEESDEDESEEEESEEEEGDESW
ncbi:MAG: excisionase family DNA-binding protein [Deltaproteobacteria bacterium]|nr:excisionase family DNA-binding protein [Deltaproteobacteria bacterium]